MDTNSLFDLTPPEKLQLVEDLWDDLAAQPGDVPLHDWQKAELDRRKAKLSNNPALSAPWPEIKAMIRNKHGR
jgi:putative addiction module component (TIGR02574 family)